MPTRKRQSKLLALEIRNFQDANLQNLVEMLSNIQYYIL